MGRTMLLDDSIRLPLIEGLIDRYPRPAPEPMVADVPAVADVSSVSAPDPTLNPSIQAFLTELLAGETQQQGGETVTAGETDYLAAERHFSDFNITLSAAAVAAIVARIRSGERPSDTVKTVPGYNWRKHKVFTDIYAIVYNELKAAGEETTIDAAREARRKGKAEPYAQPGLLANDVEVEATS